MIEIPGYKIEKEIGQGGMATVYSGVQEYVNRKVAIKIMSPSLASDPSFTERFIKEANCANLSHNNIITVYDAGCIDNHNYIVMEYIGGGDLSAAIEKGMSIEDVLSVIKQIANALSYSYQQGYVHRDVKPDNILFRDDGTVVLADFGIAKAASSVSQLTGVGKAIGSPHYMSPEQTRGLELDGRSDLYSLGIVFYEMLTGKKAYDATDMYAIGMMHMTEDIPVLPEEFSRYQPVLNKMLAKDREARYADANAVIQDLDAVTAAGSGATQSMNVGSKTTVVDMSKMQSTASGGTTVIDTNELPGITEKKSGSNVAVIGIAVVVLVGGAVAGWMMMADKGAPVSEIADKQKSEIAQPPVSNEQSNLKTKPPASASLAKPESVVALTPNVESAPKARVIQVKPVENKVVKKSPTKIKKEKIKVKPKPDQTNVLLVKAQNYLDKGQLVKPKNSNAFDTYSKVLEISSGNSEARAKLKTIAETLIHRAKKALNSEQLDDAKFYINKANTVLPGSSRLAKLGDELLEAKAMLAAMAKRQFHDKLSDGTSGPKMVKIPAGQFQMGDIQQANHDGGERPVHLVNIPLFGVGVYEVSYSEYDKFTKASGRSQANDAGWGRGNRPVVNISWEDAKAYTQWLSNETGGRYRLITESEWEYIARAGSDKKYTWGNRPGRNKANCKGCGSKWDRKKSAPVGSFKANKFGLYDLHGNVWEWVDDCWNNTYVAAPNDGSSMQNGNCASRVLRGGSWNNYPPFMRSANRDQFEISKKTNMFGFRVARDL